MISLMFFTWKKWRFFFFSWNKQTNWAASFLLFLFSVVQGGSLSVKKLGICHVCLFFRSSSISSVNIPYLNDTFFISFFVPFHSSTLSFFIISACYVHYRGNFWKKERGYIYMITYVIALEIVSIYPPLFFPRPFNLYTWLEKEKWSKIFFPSSLKKSIYLYIFCGDGDIYCSRRSRRRENCHMVFFSYKTLFTFSNQTRPGLGGESSTKKFLKCFSCPKRIFHVIFFAPRNIYYDISHTHTKLFLCTHQRKKRTLELKLMLKDNMVNR